jgi:hypothetical protein
VSHEVPGESRGHKPRYAQPEPYAVLLAKIEEVENYTHTVLQQYPKMERHLLCHDIRASLAQIQRLAVVAWKRYHKKTTLQDLDVEVEILRIWIRKSVRLKKLSKLVGQGKAPVEFITIQVNSFMAYTKHCNAHRTTSRVLGDIHYTEKGVTPWKSTIMC